MPGLFISWEREAKMAESQKFFFLKKIIDSKIVLKNQVSGAPTCRKTKSRAGKKIVKKANQKAVFSLKYIL